MLQGDTLAAIILHDICDRWYREDQLGFTISPRRSRRVGPLMVTDLYFACRACNKSNKTMKMKSVVEEVANCSKAQS